MRYRNIKTGEEYESVAKAVDRYCRRFLSNSIYGECKAFCPLHAVNNHEGSIPMCSTTYVAENEDKVLSIIGCERICDAEEQGHD